MKKRVRRREFLCKHAYKKVLGIGTQDMLTISGQSLVEMFTEYHMLKNYTSSSMSIKIRDKKTRQSTMVNNKAMENTVFYSGKA